MTKVVAILQARMSSSRLPGKVLLDLGGRSVLSRMVERVRFAKRVDQVVVATTLDPSDDPIVALCQREQIDFFRGSLPDVLDRYYQAALQFHADVIVRLTGDCPLIDPQLIDEVVEVLIDRQVDFACNRLPPPFNRTYPIGLDVEACTFSVLERAWREAVEKKDREHVLPYLYEMPGRFKVVQLNHNENKGQLRWTLDTPEDYVLLQEVIKRLDSRNDFTWLEVLELFNQDPNLASLNQDIHHKSMFDVDARTTP
jgi:spore coat polysaccharide biosynthesis protein SpsF